MTAPKTKPEPGPKPPHLVIDGKLYSQTEAGEEVFDLRVPIAVLERFMDMQDVEPQKMPRYILDNLLPESDKMRLEAMPDGAKAYEIVMKWAEKVGERLKVSLGESPRSTDSSESTETPSDSTSDATSESD